MTDLRKAAQQALEALEFDRFMPEDETHRYYTKKAITALRTALAMHQVSEFAQQQQQAEPVAWMDREGDLYKMPEIKNWAPPHVLLYTAPPQRQWVGLTDEDCKRMSAGDKLVAMWAEAKLKEKNSDSGY
jgi:hypothetical protein